MPKVKATFEISEDAYLTLTSLGLYQEKIAEEAKRFLAARLFQKKALSVGKAAEMAGLRIGDFIDFLAELQIPIIDYNKEELREEFLTAEEFLKQ